MLEDMHPAMLHYLRANARIESYKQGDLLINFKKPIDFVHVHDGSI